MKKSFTNLVLIALFSISTSIISAQQITEMPMNMSEGTNNAMMIDLPKTSAKDAAKAWEKHIKDYNGKTKKNKKTGEIFTDNALIERMSKNTVDIYSVVKEQGKGSKVIVWIDLGGAYLASATHPEQYKVAQSILNEFTAKISVGMAEEIYETEKGALEKEEDKLSKLDKNEADMKKSIADLQKKIKELEAEIKKNVEARKSQAEAVENQRIKTEKAKKALDVVKK
ncbi:MAG: hypothetical protein AB8G11_09095 [Saprospiraceae bacterium]